MGMFLLALALVTTPFQIAGASPSLYSCQKLEGNTDSNPTGDGDIVQIIILGNPGGDDLEVSYLSAHDVKHSEKGMARTCRLDGPNDYLCYSESEWSSLELTSRLTLDAVKGSALKVTYIAVRPGKGGIKSFEATKATFTCK